MRTSSNHVLGALLEEPDSSRAPSSQPQSGTVHRSDFVLPLDDEPTAKLSPELARTMLLENLRELCAAWPDQPHPALSGQTPRQLAATADGHAQLEALLRDIEQRALGTPMADAWNFERLRLELGLTPPASVTGTRAH
jgi:hypothetical protein